MSGIPNMETLAESYFEKYTAPGAAALIVGMPGSSEKTFEDDWLDFKGGQLANEYQSAAPKDKGKVKADIEKIWSELVGQFANNGGGTVVWGVDAKPQRNAHGNEVDAANGLSPIADVDAFKSLLKELDRFVTDPPLPGIRHRSVMPDENLPGGFLVSFIPEGKHKAYSAIKAAKRYLIRTGDSKMEVSNSTLRSLFYPRRSVSLLLEIKRGRDRHQTPHYTVKITNIGRHTIKDVMINIKTHVKESLQEFDGAAGTTPKLPGRTIFRHFPNNLHPGLAGASFMYAGKANLGIEIYAEDSEVMAASVALPISGQTLEATMREGEQPEPIETE